MKQLLSDPEWQAFILGIGGLLVGAVGALTGLVGVWFSIYSWRMSRNAAFREKTYDKQCQIYLYIIDNCHYIVKTLMFTMKNKDDLADPEKQIVILNMITEISMCITKNILYMTKKTLDAATEFIISISSLFNNDAPIRKMLLDSENYYIKLSDYLATLYSILANTMRKDLGIEELNKETMQGILR